MPRTTDDNTLQAVVDSIRDYAIFRLDPDGRVASWNVGAQLIKGYTADEIVGSSFTRFYTNTDVVTGRPDHLLAVARDEGRVEDEGWRVRKDGTQFWADVIISAIRDEAGTLVGFAKITRDLSERRRAEESRLLEAAKLAKANEAVRLRDEFLSIASHELRTPLMALQLQLDMVLENSGALDPKVAKKVERASRNAQRLSDLTSALLDVSRLSSGELTLSRVPVDLAVVTRDVIDHLAEAATAAKCEVIANIEGNVVGSLDPLRVAQVVSNLLVNAFKYAAGTRVEITVRRNGTQAELRVRDHGPGIADEDRARIFRRFERAAPRNLGGLGLGLYVAHQIVVAHGGTIGVETPPDGGAEFVVLLGVP